MMDAILNNPAFLGSFLRMLQAQHHAGGIQPAKSPQQQHRRTGSGATRMARLRDRRKRGFRCLIIEVCDGDIDGLVARGFLDRLHRNEPAAVERAIGAMLDRL